MGPKDMYLVLYNLACMLGWGYALALALLSAVEALTVWAGRPETFSDPLRLAHRSEHVTVNLAIAGALLLLASGGTGKFSFDHVMKKLE